MSEFLDPLFFFIIIAFSSIIHEYAHGWMADRLGDPTARLSGRLTLNPIPHIDPFGTVLLPVLMLITSAQILGTPMLFAYAKPVPVNPFNLRNSRHGTGLVAFAGPAVNIFIAVLFGIIIRFLPEAAYLTLFPKFIGIIVLANLLLAVFNLLPIPPLDGSKILFTFLPNSFNDIKVFLEAYGWYFLLIFVFFLSGIISPIISFLFTFITGQPL